MVNAYNNGYAYSPKESNCPTTKQELKYIVYFNWGVTLTKNLNARQNMLFIFPWMMDRSWSYAYLGHQEFLV